MEVFEKLDVKFPKLKFPDYEHLLEEKGIVYVESVLKFNKTYFIELGMPEGAVGVFMSGVKKIVCHDQRVCKCLKQDKKKNGRCLSVEI